jgi:hypothetical protein
MIEFTFNIAVVIFFITLTAVLVTLGILAIVGMLGVIKDLRRDLRR